MTRLKIILAILAVLVSAPLSAQEAVTQTPQCESVLGISYRAIAEPPVDALLCHGEAEFLKRATPIFEDETVVAWRDNMAPEIATGRISKSTVADMREFTPNMLMDFGVYIPAEDLKYGLLAVAGDSFRLDRHLGED